ncbi:hypothetical protein LTR53_009010, partial [Teratosphaeriaceae sp. CCFEE 6253]
FQDYLRKVGPLFEQFQRGRSEPEREGWLKKDRELEKTDRFAEALDRRLSRDGSVSPSLTRQGSFATLLSPTAETPSTLPKRRGSAQFRRNRNEPPPLSTIPTVYFDEAFHLENPRTFDVVSERAEIVRPAPGAEPKEANGAPRKPITTNAILQEKLSWYMDTVEIHLIASISTASSSFFAALGSLKQLQQEAEESVARIQGLRADLKKLDTDVAVGGLEVAAQRRRRANVGKLARATRQVERVVQEVKRADEMVEGGEYDGAADQMERVGRLVCGVPEPVAHENGKDRGGAGDGMAEQSPLIDLRPLRALQGLDAGLQDLQDRIGAGFAQRFSSILVTDLLQHIERVPSTDTLRRWARQRGIPPTYLETPPSLRGDLQAALKGLGRAGATAAATQAYRDAVQREVKGLIRRSLPSSTDDDADSMVSTSTTASRRAGGAGRMSQQEKSAVLARNLRALDEQDAEKLLVHVYTAVGEALRRVGTQTKVLLDVTSGMVEPPKSPGLGSPPRSPGLRPPGSPNPFSQSIDQQLANGVSGDHRPAPPPRRGSQRDPPDDLSQALDLSSLLAHAVDAAQTQIVKILKVRTEQTVRLPPPRFLRYVQLNRLFADECEAVSGQGGAALRGIIGAQMSAFVQVLGAGLAERVAGWLDGDEWTARDFGAGDEEVLGRVLGSGGRDPGEWAAGVKPLWEDIGDVVMGGTEEARTNGVGSHAVNGTATPVNDGPPTPTPGGPKATTTVRPATINSTPYVLVRPAILLLGPIETLLRQLPALGPSLAPTLSSALLDVLRVFNSRTAQLILGAGATRVAGLKNITTKHLALASQALGFVAAVVESGVRGCVARYLGGAVGDKAGILAEWDKLGRAYREHRGQIADKLVEIMVGRSTTHVRAMLAMMDAAAAGAVGGEDEGKLSPYMETLTKETLTLHRVLSRHLSEAEAAAIMRRIFEAYREQWCAAYRDVEVGKGVEGEKAGRRLVRDAEGFAARLGKVQGFGETGGQVLGIVRVRVGG